MRRKFHEAQDQAPAVAGWFLHQIGLLYGIERGLKDREAGPAFREVLRGAGSRMIVERIGRALRAKLGAYLPQSGMGKAIGYALGLWEQLKVFLDAGLVEIDNNSVDREIRPTAVGKKNYLFFGSPDAGQHSAIIYTILARCRRNGVDRAEYLRDVLSRLPAMKMPEVASLTPKNWKAAREQAARAA